MNTALSTAAGTAWNRNSTAQTGRGLGTRPRCLAGRVRIACLVVCLGSLPCPAQLIIDHTCTDITRIPEFAIHRAKAALHIAYGHTSHGSQITDGMTYLVGFANGGGKGLDLPADIFAWNHGGAGGALDLHDYFAPGDLGNPDRTTWAQRTRDYLDNPNHADVNVVIWSWCGQAATSIANIDIYLNLMEDLILDYPEVQFVFMTGHLDGTGQTGLLHLANEHIRQHCLTHQRILYDFADIESYDPDALVNYLPLLAKDTCEYDGDDDGYRESNWAINWQNLHTEGVDWYNCSCAHSQPLNGNQKAYAAWWLWARLAGWNLCSCDLAGDLDDNCRVDLQDFAALARSWHTDESSADIAPPPHGDGRVDLLDLCAMLETWLVRCD